MHKLTRTYRLIKEKYELVIRDRQGFHPVARSRRLGLPGGKPTAEQRPYETSRPFGVHFYHLEDGKFAEVWNRADMDAVMRQIGQDVVRR
jgi:hypothetical protein